MNAPQKKLFLLDAMALVYRAYFAFSNNHRINSNGLNTSAMFGFTNTLLEVLRKEKPSHMAVVFDTAAPTHRHDAFADYKAHRDEIPEDIAIAIPYIKRLVEAFNIPVIEMDGYEADDIIGTLAGKAERAGFETFMMTPDKDYGQLVTAHVHIYKPARLGNGAEVLGVKDVCDRYGIERPDQVIDILGLMGDAVDNIPGVPGVGEKTATALIQQFGSVDAILANTDQLKGKLKEKIELHREQALLSRQLATIHCDVPVTLDEEQLLVTDPHKDQLIELFKELEFRRLAQQVLGEEIQTPAAPASNGQMDLFATASAPVPQEEGEPVVNALLATAQTTAHTYMLVEGPEAIHQLIDTLRKAPSFSFDTETTGLDSLSADIVGLSFSTTEHQGWYVPLPAAHTEAQAILNQFSEVLSSPQILKIGQNIKYDLNVLSRYGVDVQPPLFDTMVAHYLLQPDMRHNMNALAETYLHYSPIPIEQLIGKKGKDQGNMRDVDPTLVCEYAAEDADITLQLQQQFSPRLNETGTRNLFEEVEIPLIPVLAGMEREGIRIDLNSLREFSAQLEEEIRTIDKQIQELAGTPFNVSSPRQVGDILFEVLRIAEKPKKTKTGQYATSEDILSKLSGKHPIVDRILDYRELVKLKSTYVDALPQLINPRTGRIHTTFNQVVAVTGRLSSDNPNLQNIPIRTARGREVRKAFVARDSNHVLLSADYSQIELRIMAHLCKDPGLTEAFSDNLDIHSSTAAKVFGVSLEEVTSEMRRRAKMVNFGIIYGISPFGLSERLNIPRKEAATIIENYFREYPLIKEYMESAVEQARSKGYVETLLGRRRYLRDINSQNPTVRGFAERNAINAPIQGSAADMIKIAMIRLQKTLEERRLRSKLVLQVHDELVLDVPREEIEEVKDLVVRHMESALPLSIPVLVESGTGNNWLEAH
jgi:DNA polymerase-1